MYPHPGLNCSGIVQTRDNNYSLAPNHHGHTCLTCDSTARHAQVHEGSGLCAAAAGHVAVFVLVVDDLEHCASQGIRVSRIHDARERPPEDILWRDLKPLVVIFAKEAVN